MTGGAPQRFKARDGVEIAYWEWGDEQSSPPVVLHHGFVADANSNWVAPGVVAALTAAGRRVVAPDARGHGNSGKPHDPDRYGEQRMAADLADLLEVIGAPRVDLVGYSMGAVVVLILASEDQRVRRLVVGGVGSGVVECGGVDRRTIAKEAIVEALEADDPSTITHPGALSYRQLADALGGDRAALAAQASIVYQGGVALERIAAPTLILAGDSDPLAARPEVLADAIPQAELSILSGNHLGAVGHPSFRQLVVDFLAV